MDIAENSDVYINQLTFDMSMEA